MDNIGTTYKREEFLNTISHGLGIILGIIGFFFLVFKNSNKSDYALFSIIVYTFSILLLYTASTLYHNATLPAIKSKFRILDHISIYFLIAGTYTPVALIILLNGKGWMIFTIVWVITLLGTILKLFFTGKYEFISLALYLIMGWLIIFDFQNLLKSTSDLGINLLMLGGFCYTFGIIFYAIKKIPYNHFIWHLFVLAGSICHWLFIYIDVV
ncbi:hemolysin III family protein [Cellulophaga baltica]|uniref:PAQR family membrane homeostasis protein TrhA n=1 Tax=Cellulophaga TaxID=104264 RepID=UPI001C07BABF|nr:MULTISPECIES: hemolysin III family protein [Cellulophaga]MBU2996614.1 hemolysin III family protein [Cellulophaga baltica]MDO6768008.1 hemolysin III family protein [Cellulophaga sp. 1_MG-2023]